MTDEKNGRWTNSAVLGLLTALVGIDGVSAIKSGSGDPVAAEVRANAELIRGVAEEQRELRYALKSLAGSVGALATAVKQMHD